MSAPAPPEGADDDIAPPPPSLTAPTPSAPYQANPLFMHQGGSSIHARTGAVSAPPSFSMTVGPPIGGLQATVNSLLVPNGPSNQAVSLAATRALQGANMTVAVQGELLRDVILVMAADKAQNWWRRRHYRSVDAEMQSISQNTQGSTGRALCCVVLGSQPGYADQQQADEAASAGWPQVGTGTGTAMERLIVFIDTLSRLEGRYFDFYITAFVSAALVDCVQDANGRGSRFRWVDDLAIVPLVLRSQITIAFKYQEMIDAHLNPETDSRVPLLPQLFTGDLNKVIDFFLNLDPPIAFDADWLFEHHREIFKIAVGSTIAYTRLHLQAAGQCFTPTTVRDAIGSYLGDFAEAMIKRLVELDLILQWKEQLIDVGLDDLLPQEVRAHGFTAMQRMLYESETKRRSTQPSFVDLALRSLASLQ